MKLSVIIPTYNNQELLEKCLEKLAESESAKLASKQAQLVEIIVVDNGGSCRLSVAGCQIIKNKSNLGFAGACNQGAEKATGEYLLFLNDDCFVEKNTIAEIVRFLERNQKFIATQPKIIENNKEQLGYIVDLKKGKANPTSFRSAGFHGASNIFQQGEVYGLSGTCLMIRKKIFDELKGFDASFHSYLEDVDLFIRLAKKNYHYSPTLSAVCYHQHMSTSAKMGSYKQRQDFKNWIRIIIKNYPLNFILKNFPSLFIERLRNLNGIIKKVVG